MSAPRIAIAGAGPVGLALACACRGFEVLLVEAAARAPDVPEGFDVRILALSSGTRAFLRDIGAWDRLDARRVTPVHRMEVFGDGGSRLAFSGRPGTPLAWIVEAGRLAAALEGQATSLEGVSVRRDTHASSVAAAAGGVRVALSDGTSIDADLLVGADGPDSSVRSFLGLEAHERSYGEIAVVANFETERDHGNVARQWFRTDGVLAWLPLPGRRISIVWSAPAAEGEAIAALEAAALAERVRDAGGGALGELACISRVATFPLRQLSVERVVAPGAALVGDAAHAIHPLAGQGVNLGFQDARALAAELEARSPLERPGDLRVLHRYARGRREEVAAMQFVTDGLDRLFASRASGVAWLRNAGLSLVDRQPLVKGALLERAVR